MNIKRFKLFVEENKYKNQKMYDFIKILEDNGYDVLLSHSISKGNKVVLSQQNANRDLDYGNLIKKDFIKDEKYEFIKTSDSSYPVLHLTDKNITIIFKDSKKLTKNTRHNQNELWIVTKINEILETQPSINLNFIGNNGKTISVKNITKAEHTGGETATAKNKDKADVKLYLNNSSKYFALSIKHISANFYASLVTDKNAEEIGLKALQYTLKNNQVQITRHKNSSDYVLSKSIAIDLNDKHLLSRWMFGSDIGDMADNKKPGAIIMYDYNQTDLINTENNNYKINVKIAINNVDDLDHDTLGKDYPILFLLNHADQGKRLSTIKGINVRLGNRARLTKNVIVVTQLDINKIKSVPDPKTLIKKYFTEE